MPWLNGQTPATAMGHTATIGCKEGYVIDHPEKMTVLARSGYNVQGILTCSEMKISMSYEHVQASTIDVNKIFNLINR
jgi:hypothetical protein